ncbi:uncharacterized protein VTP21DRAFT_10127 [Calcarisporiella thermophila]|uniref:uncharacterized protein n=1 Tax=Calcarisporiella thermophila TaxID=911321 RepID=UPI0037439A2F
MPEEKPETTPTSNDAVESESEDEYDMHELIMQLMRSRPLGPMSPDRIILKEPTIEAIAEYIREGKAKKIVVMTGAGVSTAAGIPDFRSAKTGIYHNLERYSLPYPEAIFDIDYFRENPHPFYALAKELYPGKFLPTKAHTFIRLLEEKGLLLRVFSQNIDTLERVAGIKDENIVEAHGSFATGACVSCRWSTTMEWIREKIFSDEIPRCEKCNELVKPDIVFFGEQLPRRFFDRLEDLSSADLLIVMGTSLKVQPFAGLIDRVNDKVPRLLINLVKAGTSKIPYVGFDFEGTYSKRDALFLGTCDNGAEKLAELCGWGEELNKLHAEICRELSSKELRTVEDVNKEVKKVTEAVGKSIDESVEERRQNKERISESST